MKPASMSLNKWITGAIAGGVMFLFLGWVVYGLLLSNYMSSYSNPAIMRPSGEIIWWALILSNLCWGILLTAILMRNRKESLTMKIRTSAVLGLLISLAVDSGLYSTYNISPDFTPVIIDVIASVGIWSICGILVGWILQEKTNDRSYL